VEFWGNGYAAEAAKVVVSFGFTDLKFNRIYAQYMVRNPASGRVLEKSYEAGGPVTAADAQMGSFRGRCMDGHSPR